jgi:hypothetical protein
MRVGAPDELSAVLLADRLGARPLRHGPAERRQLVPRIREAVNKSARALGVAAAWSWLELAAAVWTDLTQHLFAARAQCAFVAADEGVTFRRKRRVAALALLLHLESHTPHITFRCGRHPRYASPH